MGLSIVDKPLGSQGQLNLAVLNPTETEATLGKPFSSIYELVLFFYILDHG